MPHLSTLNATLKLPECHTSHFFKCGIPVTEMWHLRYSDAAFQTLKCGISGTYISKLSAK